MPWAWNPFEINLQGTLPRLSPALDLLHLGGLDNPRGLEFPEIDVDLSIPP
jgi:hypothetical protein